MKAPLLRHCGPGLLLALALGPLWAAVDVNQASEAQLDGVKGLGPAQTRLILAERERGPFQNWADLSSRVKGLGDVRARQLSAQGLRVNGMAHPRDPGTPAPRP